MYERSDEPKPAQGGSRPARLASRGARILALAVFFTCWVAIIAAPQAGAVSGISSGGSIVFIKNFNVWLTSPNGATQRQLTTDGTASKPYGDPTQSDDGNVIVAVQNRKEQQGGFIRSYVYEMNRQGTLLRAPFAPTQYTTQLGGSCTVPVIMAPQGILAAVSPDGTKIAVNPLADYYGFDCGGLFLSYVYVINLSGTVVNNTITPQSSSSASLAFDAPSWVSNSRLLLYHDIENGIYYYDLGTASAKPWVASADFTDNAYQYPSLKSGKLATTGGDSSGEPVLRLWTTNGGPPTAPTARCDIPNPDPSKYDFFTFEFIVPRLAPDGGALTWMEIDKTGSTPKTSIYVSPVGNISGGNCSSLNRQLLIAGGSDPFWGPAALSSK